MGDGSASAPLWLPVDPAWDALPMPARMLMLALIIWRDGRGSCDPTEADLAALTGMNVSTVRKHAKALAKDGEAWAVRERRRRPDNSLGGYRYWLDLEKLGLGRGDRWEPAVAPDAGEGVGKPVENADEATAGSQRSGGATAVSTAGSQRSQPLGNSGPIEEHGPARAEISLPSFSYFHSFPWSDDVTKVRAGEVLAACGEGLGHLGEQNNRVLLSLAYVLEPGGVWSGFDHALDVLPVVKLKTGPGRASKLWDFALLTENIERYRLRRLRPERGAAAAPKRGPRGGSPPPAEASPHEARVKRMATLRREIAIIERGERPLFLLPTREQRFTGEFLEDAFAALHARNVLELARLEEAARQESVVAEGSA